MPQNFIKVKNADFLIRVGGRPCGQPLRVLSEWFREF